MGRPPLAASMIWIIGEYADRIANAAELLEQLTTTFEEDSVNVQLQLLTATVKLFLKKPDAGKDLVQRVLQLATTGSDNPDLRDRGYIYWRLLSTDPAIAKVRQAAPQNCGEAAPAHRAGEMAFHGAPLWQAVVLAEKPPIADTTDALAGSLLDELINNLGTIASVYHKPPSSFLTGGKIAPLSVKQLQKLVYAAARPPACSLARTASVLTGPLRRSRRRAVRRRREEDREEGLAEIVVVDNAVSGTIPRRRPPQLALAAPKPLRLPEVWRLRRRFRGRRGGCRGKRQPARPGRGRQWHGRHAGLCW